MGTNSAPLLADLFLHTFKYDFMVKTMKHDISKAIQFSNTFRCIDDLFSTNNVDFGNYISAIYPPELQLTDTSTSSTEVCYLDTHIKTRKRANGTGLAASNPSFGIYKWLQTIMNYYTALAGFYDLLSKDG